MHTQTINFSLLQIVVCITSSVKFIRLEVRNSLAQPNAKLQSQWNKCRKAEAEAYPTPYTRLLHFMFWQSIVLEHMSSFGKALQNFHNVLAVIYARVMPTIKR